MLLLFPVHCKKISPTGDEMRECCTDERLGFGQFDPCSWRRSRSQSKQLGKPRDCINDSGSSISAIKLRF